MTKIPQSNYTQVPNVFFDEILEGLNLAETKVLLVLFNKVWYNRLCGESALYTSSRPFNL